MIKGTSHEIFFSLKMVILVVYISEMTAVYKNNLKVQNYLFLFVDGYCENLGPGNYVSMRKRGTRCIAPKLQGAHFEGLKTPRGAAWGVQNSAGQICLQSLPCGILDPSICARRVLDPSKCDPRSFGAMQHVPHFQVRAWVINQTQGLLMYLIYSEVKVSNSFRIRLGFEVCWCWWSGCNWPQLWVEKIPQGPFVSSNVLTKYPQSWIGAST